MVQWLTCSLITNLVLDKKMLGIMVLVTNSSIDDLNLYSRTNGEDIINYNYYRRLSQEYNAIEEK